MIARTDFIRQRKWLIGISILLLFVELSELQFQEITFLGNKVQIQNPSILLKAIWIFFFYYLIRYYQHFRDLDNKRIIFSFQNKLDKIIFQVAFKKLLKQPDFIKKYEDRAKEKPWLYKNREHEVRDRSIKKYTCYIFILFGPEPEKGVIENELIDLKFRELLIPRLKALFFILVHTSIFTEYFLPFAISLIPIGYKGYKIFQGIPFNKSL